MASSNRLISQFNPDSYQLSLDLNKKSKLFSGKLQITGSRRGKPSYRITFNQAGLRVSRAKIYSIEKGFKKEIKVARIVHQNKLQEVRLHTDHQLTSGKYQVELEYSGKVSTKGTNGFYTSTWLDAKTNQHEILATQFEPHYARQLLPCVDEPEAKAIFELDLRLDPKSDSTAMAGTVLFNTEAESDQEVDGVREVHFSKTPVISTYLLALIIGDLKCKTAKSSGGTIVNVYTTPDKLETTSFALEFTLKALDLLEKKFKTPYPLPKLDLVAVPDFDAGGMENWGLITFREDLLLFDESNSTLADKQMISLIIAHELAHQWFGNLVTMKWWDELWLNEGFANFIEYYLVDQLYPEWKALEQYLITEKSYAIRLDSLPSSRPIVNKVKTPHQAVDSFDGIAYEKSGSIIRMIFSILGEENFMLGLKDYFQKFSYKSASSSDLINCWQKYTKLKLSEFVRSWLYEPGLPVVQASIGKNPQQIKLEQSRFLSESNPKVNIAQAQKSALKAKPNINKQQRQFYLNEIENRVNKVHNPVWQVPISFIYDSVKETSGTPQDARAEDFVMKNQSHSVQLPKNSTLPIKLNRSGESFYVTNYSLEFLAGISQALKNGRLSDPDTLNVLSDIISLNRAGQFEPGSSAILEIILIANKTANAQFWSLTGGFVGYLHYHLKQVGKTKLLNAYICSLIDAKVNEVGFEANFSDDSSKITARFELLSLAVLAQDSNFTPKLLELFDRSREAVQEIESEKRLLVLYAVAKRGKKADYKVLLASYKQNLSDPSLRDDLTYALCLFEDADLVKSNLQLMQDSELVKSQDILAWLSQLIGSGNKGLEITLKWLTKEGGWCWLSDNLSPHDLSSTVKIAISSAFITKDLNKLKKYFEDIQNVEIEKALKESLDMAKSRISWHKKELPQVIDYLSNYRG